MAKIGLDRSGIDPIIGQLEAAGVAQHVRVDLHIEPSSLAFAVRYVTDCVATRTTAVGSSLAATSIAARPDRDKTFAGCCLVSPSIAPIASDDGLRPQQLR